MVKKPMRGKLEEAVERHLPLIVLIAKEQAGRYGIPEEFNKGRPEGWFADLVRESFKNRGSIPILLTLTFLSKLTEKSFQFAAGLDILTRGTNQHFSDIDLACVCDGRLIIVECKDLEDGIGDKGLNDVKEQLLSLRKWGANINIDSVILSTLIHPLIENGKILIDWVLNIDGMPPLKIFDKSELTGIDDSMRSATPITNIRQLFT